MRLSVAIALALIAAPAAAQPARETPLEGVVVEGKPSPEVARAQVRGYLANAVAPKNGETLLRWREPICPLVAGLPAEQGEYILARVTLIARTAGAKLAPERCVPNFYIVVTAEPDALLKAWRKRDGNLFGRKAPAKVGRFLGQPRPVRVWRNWDYAPADGSRPTEYTQYGAPSIGHPKDSRIVANVVHAAWGAFAVVDSAHLKGVSVAQLADYVALTGLAELTPDAAEASAPTILRLFDGAPADAPEALTAWDVAFLKALYGSEQDNLMQRAQIANRMVADVTR